MPRRLIATVVVGIAVLAAGLGLVALGADRYTALASLEQRLLTPWLGPTYLGDGGPARELLLCNPMGLTFDRRGNLLISDRGRGRRGRVIWRIDADGYAHIVAGTGLRGDGSGRRADTIDFDRPEGMAVAPDGSLFVSDGFNHAVYRIDASGEVARVAGTGVPGYSGDGGPGAEATLNRPADIRLDRRGDLYIADVKNERVRKLDPSGIITTVAGTGEKGFSPDGTPAAEARLDTPWGIGLDPQDRLLIGDGKNHRVRRVDPDGRLVTIAGSGRRGFSGDGGPALEACFDTPESLNYDAAGRLYIGDELNNAVRVVDLDGTISTLIGNGFPGRARMGDPAHGSPVNDPETAIVAPDGDVIVVDGENGRVLRIGPDRIVRLLAGRGETEVCFDRF